MSLPVRVTVTQACDESPDELLRWPFTLVGLPERRREVAAFFECDRDDDELPVDGSEDEYLSWRGVAGFVYPIDQWFERTGSFAKLRQSIVQ